MSDRLTSQVHFAIVPEWLIRSSVSAVALRVYAALARHADSKQQAFPSRRVLAEWCGKSSVRTIDAAIDELEKVGAVVVTRRSKGNVKQSNLYQLQLVEPEGVAQPIAPGGSAANCTRGSAANCTGVVQPVAHRTRANEREPIEREKRGTRIPTNFTVSEEMRAWAAEKVPMVNVDEQTERFIDFWRAKSGAAAVKQDWVATWRNWMRNAKKWAPDAPAALPPELRGQEWLL